MHLALWGKEYIDKIFNLKTDITLGETNSYYETLERKGGIYNIRSIDNLKLIYFPEEKKETIILSEAKNSRRTSLVNCEKKNM